ncbi:MAG: RsmB/NOP family class I SAM-dependent RNA methyltransferase [Ignavibacteria bacterium]|nr:RsmB/NOP family class I SAM-dependent RNA methyltransferase [Ignavibacteria bacterium]
MPIPSSLHDAVRQSFDDVVISGRHLSTAIENLFRTVHPAPGLATTLRSTLFQAIRYNNVEAALAGSLDTILDPDLADIPPFLRELVAKTYGKDQNKVLCSFLTDAPTFVRVNTLKVSVDECLRALRPFQAVRVEGYALRIDRPFALFSSEAFEDGWFEQMDVTSQRAAHELNARPGQRIIDACAGAGGKTLLFAASMQNKGRIIALDTHAGKLQALCQRMARAGADIIDPRVITTTKVVKRLNDTADGVFIDVPCTGTGVVRRNPDILRNLTEKTYKELLVIQADILRRNARLAKPGGTVVYATCSVLPSEGKEQIKNFLASEDGEQFKLAYTWQTLPGDNGGDGFYVARLTRSSAA